MSHLEQSVCNFVPNLQSSQIRYSRVVCVQSDLFVVTLTRHWRWAAVQLQDVLNPSESDWFIQPTITCCKFSRKVISIIDKHRTTADLNGLTHSQVTGLKKATTLGDYKYSFKKTSLNAQTLPIVFSTDGKVFGTSFLDMRCRCTKVGKGSRPLFAVWISLISIVSSAM